MKTFVTYFSGDRGHYDGQHIKQCPLPCNNLEMTFGYPMVYPTTEPFVTLYFDQWVSVRENQLLFPTSSLFAEIGGYMGLLLGLSLFDVAKFFVVVSEKIQSLNEIFRRP